MAAGLYCITTNYGALFETGAEFPMYIPYDKEYKSCLLYTSPSPRDRTRSRMPSSA